MCPLKSRFTPAIALTLTSVERWICQNDVRVKLVDQILDRPADQRLLVGGHHQRVLVVGLEIADFLDGDEAHVVALRRRDPAQVLFAAVTLGRKRLQDAVQIGWRAAQLCLEPRDGRRKPRRREWFHHVVDRALLEGRDRMLVVGGDEYDVAPATGLLSDFEAVQARHLDVEEHDVGRQPLDAHARLRCHRRFRR